MRQCASHRDIFVCFAPFSDEVQGDGDVPKRTWEQVTPPPAAACWAKWQAQRTVECGPVESTGRNDGRGPCAIEEEPEASWDAPAP
ncbi:hypothetical protein HMPREF9946_05229 [Acetobacteraceae bacterium AT-5844]|nr:hypothetical protein HMPREF9946_05229 [Acetobacteraceae bacterium AT-5844]